MRGTILLLVAGIGAACAGGGVDSDEPTPTTGRTAPADASPTAEPEVIFEACPRWQIGDSANFVRTSIRQQFGRPHTVISDVEISVKDKTPQGFALDFAVSLSSLSDLFEEAEELLGDESVAALRELNETPLQIETTRCGGYVSTSNWPEIREILRRALRTSYQGLVDSGEITVEQLETVLTTILDGSDAELALLDDELLFFEMFDSSYSSVTPLTLDDVTVNPLGGDPFPTEVSYSLTQYDEETECATIIRRSTIDPDEMTRILAESIEDFGGEVDSTPPPFDIADRAITSYCGGDLWPTFVSFRREITIDRATQVVSEEYRLQTETPVPQE